MSHVLPDEGGGKQKGGVEQGKVGLLSLVTVSFFWVSGGIYGNEVLIQSAPPFYVFACLLLFPLAYSLPVSLITAELATALPEDGGVAVWAQEAFGKQLGGHVAYWMWVSSIMDTASYPALATDFLSELAPMPGYMRQLIAVCFAVLVTLVKLRSIRDTIWMSGVIMVCAILPLLVYVAFGISFLDLDAIVSKQGPQDWRLLLNWMTWNFAGFMSVGAIAGQVDRPQYVYPRRLRYFLLWSSFKTHYLLLSSSRRTPMPRIIMWDTSQHWPGWQEDRFCT
jgi:amino acid transporter